jgi:hypothetical protein
LANAGRGGRFGAAAIAGGGGDPMGGLARNAGWGGWRTGAWDNGWNGGWNGWDWGLGAGLASFALGAAFGDPYAYWGGWGPYWGWPAYADYDPWDYGYWDYGYWDPWWDAGWAPSAYYGWDWWRRHHRYRRASYASYADYYGYGGPTYGYADYSPAYDGYPSAAYATDYSGPALNPAYLSQASYSSRLCVQRHYEWDDYYGNYVERLTYVPC